MSSELINSSTKKLIVVEGYEMVTKTTFINSLDKNNYLYYRPSYEELSIDSILSRSDRYILGLATIDMFNQNRTKVGDRQLVLDRSLPSSLVYSKLYNGVEYSDMQSVIDAYMKLYIKLGTVIVYKYHLYKDLAKEIYTTSVANRKGKLDKYDVVSSFEDYWMKYEIFNDEYLKVFDMLDLDIIHSPAGSESFRSDIVSK